MIQRPEKNCESLPERKTKDFAAGKRAIKSEYVQGETSLHKRLKSSSFQTSDQWSQVSNESLTPELLHKLLNEPCPLGLQMKPSRSFLELLEACVPQTHASRRKKDVKARVAVSAPVDKLKATNFPAVLLRIGHWEYASKYEGDLVAKCYFAKHKLVWEVLDGSLKNKIEIQWGDIVALKANCPDVGPSTLIIVLGKPPLFFRETDPQPRKHTVWQPTSDFTGGAASKYRLHYLQCSQGVLKKHYEKLIQCDTRLNFLCQPADLFMDSPFAAKDSVKNPNGSNNNGPNQLEMPILRNTATLNMVHGDFIKEYGPGHTAHCISDVTPVQILPVHNNMANGVNETRLISSMSQVLLTDKQFTTDEKSPVSTVNVSNDYSAPENKNENENENEKGMSRDDSFSKMLDQLPPITPLPSLLFENSQDGVNMGYYS